MESMTVNSYVRILKVPITVAVEMDSPLMTMEGTAQVTVISLSIVELKCILQIILLIIQQMCHVEEDVRMNVP